MHPRVDGRGGAPRENGIDNSFPKPIQFALVMRHQPWTNLLLGLVAVSVLATAGLAFFYVRSVQKLNQLQFQASVVNRNRALVNALAAESVEYAKRNPAMQALLQSVGIRPNSAANASAQTRP